MQGIEKKTTKLQGCEKGVVARHEAGHAVVGTAVANLLTGQPRVEVEMGLHRSNMFFFLPYYLLLFGWGRVTSWDLLAVCAYSITNQV